jgi:hypothetical protein
MLALIACENGASALSQRILMTFYWAENLEEADRKEDFRPAELYRIVMNSLTCRFAT